MLPKNRRITKSMFDMVLKKGFVVHSPLFTLRFIKDRSQVEACISVVAPKGIAKKAVLRNSLRRKGYRAIQTLTIPKGITAILLYKKPAITASFGEIKNDIEILLKKI